MEDFLDPQLLQQSVLPTNEDDLFGVDVKPDVNKDEVKVEAPEHDEEMEDLFGDEEAVAEPAKEKSPTPAVSTGREGSEALSAAELRHRQELEYEEDEGQDENVVELKHAVLSIPNIPMPKSSDGNYWVIRMPNFVKLDSKPFHPDTYVSPDQSYGGSEREKSMGVKLEVENTIRWRWTKDEFGQDIRQSNGRIIRWSDGTMSLLLGKELFDISQTYEGAPGVPRQASSIGSIPQSQSHNPTQNSPQQQPAGRGSGLIYLVAQHKRSGILQTEIPVTGHMSLRPTGMQSETHRRLARAVGQKHSRVARLRMADANVERDAQEALKAALKKPKRTRAGARENGELGGPARRRRVYGRRRERESVWSDEEPEPGTFEETDEEDEGDFASSPRRRRGSGEGRADSKRGAGEYQTDDFLVADSSEGDEDLNESPRRKHKGKKHRRRSYERDAEGEADELEKLDAKIAQQEEERRRKKQAGEAKEEGTQEGAAPAERQESAEVVMDMDVESEEEEEEFNIRRTGTGSRKPRAIALDDEDE